MGILNITPDSFYDGGQLYAGGRVNLDAVLTRAEAMQRAGATILDVGGESTRPGAVKISPEHEIERVLPVIEALNSRLNIVLSVDTSNAALITAAASAGAGMINDVRALTAEGALAAAAATGLPVCLMHMQGRPADMQVEPHYDDVVAEVASYLKARTQACVDAGIAREAIILDPGFGFGKTDTHNLRLLRDLHLLKALALPLLVGLSRKSMIGRLLGRDLDQRLPASIALALIAQQNGASILRVHDVAETADALAICARVNNVP